MKRGPLRVELDLDARCIETAARQEHARLARLLLGETDAPSEEAGAALELLRRFLEETNFGRLRAARPELSGRDRLRIALWQRPDTSFEIENLRKRNGDQECPASASKV